MSRKGNKINISKEKREEMISDSRHYFYTEREES